MFTNGLRLMISDQFCKQVLKRPVYHNFSIHYDLSRSPTNEKASFFVFIVYCMSNIIINLDGPASCLIETLI